MWALCLDEAVLYGTLGQNSNYSQEREVRIGKGLSPANHALSVEQFTEVVNYNYPSSLFFFLREAIRSMSANCITAITM